MDEVESDRLKLRWFLKCMELLESQDQRNEAGGEVYIASKGIELLEKKAVRKYSGSDSPICWVGQSGPYHCFKPQLAVTADIICPDKCPIHTNFWSDSPVHSISLCTSDLDCHWNLCPIYEVGQSGPYKNTVHRAAVLA